MPQILDAARIDGAGEGQVMGQVVLPLLSGVIVNAAILCISGSLNSFALIYAMTGGGPARVTQLLSIYMYENAFVGTPNFPLANAIAMSIVIFSIVLIVLTKLAERRWGGRSRPCQGPCRAMPCGACWGSSARRPPTSSWAPSPS